MIPTATHQQLYFLLFIIQIGTKWHISRDENKCVLGRCVIDEDGECAELEKYKIICDKPCPKVYEQYYYIFRKCIQ